MLNSVREELTKCFKELRKAHRELSAQEKFYLVTGENEKSFYENKLVTGTVSR